MKRLDRNEWIDTLNVEIECYINDGTHKFLPKSSVKDKWHLVIFMWVLKKKCKPSMKSNKYKARTVARGFTQTKGINYNEISSTIARSESWRILMA